MKTFFQSRDGASNGAALLITLALVVLLTGLALAYFSRTTTDRQLAHSSYNDTSADLLARSALDIVVGDFKQEILAHPTVTPGPPFYITPVPYGTPAGGPTVIPNLIRRSFAGDPTNRTSSVPSTSASANGRSISRARWNSHYLIPRADTGNTIDSTPVLDFTAPDWVLVTPQGPAQTPTPNAVIGRYAMAVYDEGGLLDMSLAGYPNWASSVFGTCNPAPTPWLVNVGRKGIVAFADLTAFPFLLPQTQVDKIVGWRNYAMSQQPVSFFPSGNPSFPADCNKQNWYGSYLLDFGDPPFTIESLADKLAASIYPFTSVAGYVYPTPAPGVNSRTDQALITRQQLLELRNALGFSQNVLQYMGTFSRERNWPAPDWPGLNGGMSDGRFNLNNLALVIPNPNTCANLHGKKVGWTRGKNRNHICGTTPQILDLFGLTWVPSDGNKTPGYWFYTKHTGPNPPGFPDPNPHSVICFNDTNFGRQKDFFQILHFALNVRPPGGFRCDRPQARIFGIGASLIDQYDSGSIFPGGNCYDSSFGHIQQFGNPLKQLPGCDLDAGVSSIQYATHTTVIRYGQGSGDQFAFGIEKDYDSTTGDGDLKYTVNDNAHPHRPCGGKGGDCIPQEPTPPAVPTPQPGLGSNETIVINHAFSSVGELGYGIDTSSPTATPFATPLPTLDFNSPDFLDAPVLDFFSYNPISSAYPRAGIVNLYTRNAPVLAAMLASAWKTELDSANPNPASSPSGRISVLEATNVANAIVQETQRVLAGTSTWPVTQTDMTRAIAARLVAAGGNAIDSNPSHWEQRESISRALAEMGQTRTWNLLIDVIAQTGKYMPGTTPPLNDSNANKFVVEGEKRYWLHISLGRDLVKVDPINGTVPCQPGDTGCVVDVLGTQLEEVIE